MKIAEIKKYIYNIRYCILLSSIIFFLGFLIGYDFVARFPNETEKIIKEFRSIINISENSSSFDMFLFVLENNIIKLTIIFALGILAGIIPIIASFANGMILGIFLHLTSKEMPIKFFAAGILPHGIIEIPALILLTAASINIGKTAVQKLFNKKINIKEEISQGIRFLVFVIIPLIFIAALIEAFATPIFLENV